MKYKYHAIIQSIENAMILREFKLALSCVCTANSFKASKHCKFLL